MNRDLAWPPFGLPFPSGPLHKSPRNHSRAHTPSAELTAHPDPRVRWADGHLHVPSPGSTAHALLCPQWSEDVCAAHLTQRDGYQATTQGQLKEQLYQEIIHYFDKGKVKKKKMRLFSRSPFFVHLPSVVNTFFNIRCLWNQEFVTNCILEGFVRASFTETSE